MTCTLLRATCNSAANCTPVARGASQREHQMGVGPNKFVMSRSMRPVNIAELGILRIDC